MSMIGHRHGIKLIITILFFIFLNNIFHRPKVIEIGLFIEKMFRACVLAVCVKLGLSNNLIDVPVNSTLDYTNYVTKYVSYENTNRSIPLQNHVVKSFYVDVPATNYTFLLSRPEDFQRGYGYSNFRLIGNASNINLIVLRVGGLVVSKHNPKLSLLRNPFHLMDEQYALPALKNQLYSVYTESDAKFEVQYDVVTLQNPVHNYNYLFMNEHWHTVFFGNHSGWNTLECFFKKPIHSIGVFVPNDVKSVNLWMNNKFKMPMLKNGNRWYLKFHWDLNNNVQVAIRYNTSFANHSASYSMLYKDRVRIYNDSFYHL